MASPHQTEAIPRSRRRIRRESPGSPEDSLVAVERRSLRFAWPSDTQHLERFLGSLPDRFSFVVQSLGYWRNCPSIPDLRQGFAGLPADPDLLVRLVSFARRRTDPAHILERPGKPASTAPEPPILPSVSAARYRTTAHSPLSD